ncbi:MAG: hypothetical protein M1828_006728 [Chrysothrix sp. TS-e1954]|nr:MAG: hypothetical protein M1828_006728 [Chrysothrix sp. TS-e1954]
MHYVRFLKPLRCEHTKKGGVSLRTLITLNTDLGDSVYKLRAALEVTLLGDPGTVKEQSHGSIIIVQWDARRDVLPVTYCVDDKVSSAVVALSIQASNLDGQSRHANLIHDVSCDDVKVSMPFIIGARSSSLVLGAAAPLEVDSKFIRLVPTTPREYLPIWENADNSIAGHVWDAGVALSACLVNDKTRETKLAFMNMHLIQCIVKKGHVDAVELGSGCGLVGLCLARTFQACKLVLTDVEEARATLQRNLEAVEVGLTDKSNLTSRVEIETLDWEHDLPASISSNAFDLVIVSDCTYNADSTPALVRTIARLVQSASNALIVVALKKRHDSEDILFQLMDSAQFAIVSAVHVEAPYGQNSGDGGFPDETIDIYTYKRRGKA